MNDVLDRVLDDLAAESQRLEDLLAGQPGSVWRTATPAAGWDVATQVAHLAWTDEVAVAAATDKERWDGYVLAAMADPTGFVDAQALEGGAVEPDALLERWRAARAALAGALRAHPDGERMPWFGPPMSATSMATARYMETWAHALDVQDALGVEPVVTDAIRHVAHLGVRTRDFAHHNNHLEPPTEEFRVELTAPSGETWTWGPAEAGQRVTGSAYDFCRLVTQRVHRDDTDLVAVGADAERWLGVAQCFAGPAGGGRPASGDRNDA